jgi:hypothetical protein
MEHAARPTSIELVFSERLASLLKEEGKGGRPSPTKLVLALAAHSGTAITCRNAYCQIHHLCFDALLSVGGPWHGVGRNGVLRRLGQDPR